MKKFFEEKMMKKTTGALLLLLMFVSMFLVGCNGNPFEGSHVVSFNPNNGDETINILVKNGHKAKAPSMAYNDDGLPFMEWRTSDDKAFDLGTPITSDMELTAAYYQKMTPEADFDVKCINWISSGFYWGVYNHLEALIDEKGLLKPVDTDKDSGEESSESGLYEGENISEIEYVLSNMKNLSDVQHVLGTLFIANGTNDEMTVEYSYGPETIRVLTLRIGDTEDMEYVFALDLDLFNDSVFLASIDKRGWRPFTDLEDKTTYDGIVGKLSFYVSKYGKLYDSKEVFGMEGLNLKIQVKPNDETYNYEVNVDLSKSEAQLRIYKVNYEHEMIYNLCLNGEWKSPVKIKSFSFIGGRPYRSEAFYQHFYDVEETTPIT